MMLHACRLKAPTALEYFDIQSDDPFTPENCPFWKPNVFFKTYENAVCSNLEVEAERTENMKNVKTEAADITDSEDILSSEFENAEIGKDQRNLKRTEIDKLSR